MNAIKELCHQDIGIIFMYSEAVKTRKITRISKRNPCEKL